MGLFIRDQVAADVQEFGAVQADAVGAARPAVGHLVRKLDVAVDRDPLAVGRHGRQIAQGFQLGRPRLMLFGFVAVAGNRFFVGLQDDQPLVAVDDDHVAARDISQERAGADHGRNLQCRCHDGGMAARPAGFGDEAADKIRAEIGRFAGRERVREHDHRRDQRGQLFAAAAEQLAQEPLFDVEDVARPVGQKTALQGLEDLGIAAQDPADGILGRVMPLADHGFDLAPQPHVAEHLQMGGEDRAVIVAQLFANLLAIGLDFAAGGRDGGVQTLELMLDGVAGDEPPRDAKALLVDDQGFAHGDAR